MNRSGGTSPAATRLAKATGPREELVPDPKRRERLVALIVLGEQWDCWLQVLESGRGAPGGAHGGDSAAAGRGKDRRVADGRPRRCGELNAVSQDGGKRVELRLGRRAGDGSAGQILRPARHVERSAQAGKDSCARQFGVQPTGTRYGVGASSGTTYSGAFGAASVPAAVKVAGAAARSAR